jgi:hypothetical protein
MKIELHQIKANAVERSVLAHCPVADYETVIEGAMLAGTHWLNVLLHRTGIRPPERDAIHAEFLSAGERRLVSVMVPGALQALDAIENFRTLYVRGDMPNGEEAARSSLQKLSHLRRLALDHVHASL